MKTFGIGCFHFGITDKMQIPFSMQEYVKEIEAVLRKITNISQIHIDFQDPIDKEKKIFTYDGNIPSFSDGQAWFPHLMFLNISFTIYIPYRVQVETLEIPEQYLETQSEKFKVSIKNCYHCPVTFITPLDATSQECQASDSVILLRRYLSKEIQKQNGKLKFECIGPSPFHANFFLELKQDIKTTRFDLIKERKNGYDKLSFIGGSNIYENENDALCCLFNVLDDEISFFYSIMFSHVSLYNKWEVVNSCLALVMHPLKRKRIWECLQEFCERGKKLCNLVEEICDFRSFIILEKHALTTGYNNIYTSEKYLKQYIDDELINPPLFPIDEISELVRFKEQRYSKFWQNFILLASAILGGIVGSVLTYFFTKS